MFTLTSKASSYEPYVVSLCLSVYFCIKEAALKEKINGALYMYFSAKNKPVASFSYDINR